MIEFRWMTLAVVVGALGCATTNVELRPQPRGDLMDPGALVFNGYTHADVRCWSCHDGSGRGSVKAPNLASRVPRRTRAALIETITHGLRKMPAFEGDLTAGEIEAVVDWLQATFKPVE